MLNSEPTDVFPPPPPWFLQKCFADNTVLVVLNRFLKIFLYKFSTFDHLDKDMQVVRVILAHQRQANFKTSRNVGKGRDLNMDLQR
jgi:hypothetical protein